MGSILLDQLDEEWAWLAHSRRATLALTRWAQCDAELREFADLNELVTFVNRRDRLAEGDAILYRLVCRAHVDELAARTVLACMMPGIKRLTCNFRWAHESSDEASAAVLAVMWERIRTYPCVRRPAKIAANIQLDTRQRVGRRVDRECKQRAAGVLGASGCPVEGAVA